MKKQNHKCIARTTRRCMDWKFQSISVVESFESACKGCPALGEMFAAAVDPTPGRGRQRPIDQPTSHVRGGPEARLDRASRERSNIQPYRSDRQGT